MNKKILLKTDPNKHFVHFVHSMQYFYWVTDNILNDTNMFYVILEPDTLCKTNTYKTKYVVAYLNKLSKIFSNFILVKTYKKNDIYKVLKYKWNDFIKTKYILNNKDVDGKYRNWFPFNNFTKIRHHFLNNNKKKKSNNRINIGLINRQNNRILLNYKAICDNIYSKFKIKVNITYFEDKSFDYQIQFLNDHDIIISPHGAQLCSIPFAKDNALIIECASIGWHPYRYFTGLSYTSNKYHVILCKDHTVFPNWCTNKKNKNKNIITNPQKIINVIDLYFKNSNNLKSHYCYLK